MGNHRYLDGYIADSIPLKHFVSMGFSRNLVILTQSISYRQKLPHPPAPHLSSIPLSAPPPHPHPDILPAFADDGATVLARFREANPDVRLYVCTPTPLAPARLEAAANRAIRETLVPLAENLALRTGARLIPVHAVYPCTPDRLPDGTHPDAQGARLIAETVYQALQR